MGGRGSGWHRGRKITVEECVVLDAAEMAHNCFDLPGSPPASRVGHGLFPAGLHYSSQGTEYDRPGLRVDSLLVADRNVLTLGQPIRFETSRVFAAATRWWFCCPLCERRVRKLYLPPISTAPGFACRRCHKLTYWSVRTHDKRYDRGGRRLIAQLSARLENRKRRHR